MFLFLIEGKKISEGDKQGVYWQVAMPLLMDNRDVSFRSCVCLFYSCRLVYFYATMWRI